MRVRDFASASTSAQCIIRHVSLPCSCLHAILGALGTFSLTRNAVAAELGVPLQRARKDEPIKPPPEDQPIRFVYDDNDLLDVISGISNPNHVATGSKSPATPSWGCASLPPFPTPHLPPFPPLLPLPSPPPLLVACTSHCLSSPTLSNACTLSLFLPPSLVTIRSQPFVA